jgi:hypothetical protein
VSSECVTKYGNCENTADETKQEWSTERDWWSWIKDSYFKKDSQ